MGQHGFGLLQDVVVPVAQDGITLCLQPCGTGIVAGVVVMLPAVGFDDEVFFEADEIGDVVADGVLAFEFVAAQATITQVVPEALFSFGHGAAQPLGLFLGTVTDSGAVYLGQLRDRKSVV